LRKRSEISYRLNKRYNVGNCKHDEYQNAKIKVFMD
jgi:hypothetical protein